MDYWSSKHGNLQHEHESKILPSIVPGQVTFSMQWRDAELDRLLRIDDIVRSAALDVAKEMEVSVSFGTMLGLDPVEMDKNLMGALEYAANKTVGSQWSKMHSGALHDATNVARLMPTAMLFVPSISGISHSFDENTDDPDLISGIRVLATAVDYLYANVN